MLANSGVEAIRIFNKIPQTYFSYIYPRVPHEITHVHAYVTRANPVLHVGGKAVIAEYEITLKTVHEKAMVYL